MIDESVESYLENDYIGTIDVISLDTSNKMILVWKRNLVSHIQILKLS